MSPLFIVDNAAVPARYGVTASLWASRLGLPLWSLRPDFAGDVPDSHQHVIRAGYCVTSGLWRGATLRAEVRAVAQLPAQNAVVVLSPAQLPAIDALPGTRLYSHDHGDRLTLSNGKETLLRLSADRYGRWACAHQTCSGRSLRIGLLGREADHRLVYPATLGALGDAATALNLRLDIRFLSPAACAAGQIETADLHGVVLPGGASMAVVAGQIRLADATFNSGLPTLGLCLGMQSMATAAVRRQTGYQQALPAEVAPDAPLHSFIAFGDGHHRCGVLPFTPQLPLPGKPGEMHYNHRYYFNPCLLAQLTASGVVISAQTGVIVEAISLPRAPFWHGVQGHPELMSRPGAPHPLFSAFLQAAVNRQG